MTSSTVWAAKLISSSLSLFLYKLLCPPFKQHGSQEKFAVAILGRCNICYPSSIVWSQTFVPMEKGTGLRKLAKVSNSGEGGLRTRGFLTEEPLACCAGHWSLCVHMCVLYVCACVLSLGLLWSKLINKQMTVIEKAKGFGNTRTWIWMPTRTQHSPHN